MHVDTRSIPTLKVSRHTFQTDGLTHEFGDSLGEGLTDKRFTWEGSPFTRGDTSLGILVETGRTIEVITSRLTDRFDGWSTKARIFNDGKGFINA